MTLALDGRVLGLVWVMPFVGLLLSIALLPRLHPELWPRHVGKIAAAWTLAFLVPCALRFGLEVTAGAVIRVEIQDFVPFLLLVGALYTVTGGVRVTGTIRGTPVANTLVLGLGTGLASVMGTTGAAMLIIRPLLRANQQRRHRAHIIIFLIFLVGNIGGALSPLGNPPLLLGFLQGVDFFWPLQHLLAPTALLVAVLLALFYIIDRWCWQREAPEVTRPPAPHEHRPLGLEGGVNLWLLAAIVAVVLLQALWQPGIMVPVFTEDVALQTLVAQLLLVAITLLSLRLTTRKHRNANAFTWLPMTEVTKLFGAIFITIIPALAILDAGHDGAASGLLSALDQGGQPVPALYFWSAGLLSALLDNAPTYLIFFHAAGGDPDWLMTGGATTLAAISAGAVFMGAVTYIGNVPNFLAKSVAEESGVVLPGFFAYMVWSVGLLLPLFVVTTVLFLL